MEKERIILHLNAELRLGLNLQADAENEIKIDRCTMLVGDGTYNGVYFPKEELEKAFSTFEGKPININHSAEKVEDIVGHIENVEYEDGKIVAETFFDEETSKYNEAMGYIKSRIKAGDIPNVSVGVWLTRELEENEETGEKRFIARELEGDHLALVVHGACSPEDGCGIGGSCNNSVTISHEDYVDLDEVYKDFKIKVLKEQIKKEKLVMEEEK